jgi:hypothetical protein
MKIARNTLQPFKVLIKIVYQLNWHFISNKMNKDYNFFQTDGGFGESLARTVCNFAATQP